MSEQVDLDGSRSRDRLTNWLFSWSRPDQLLCSKTFLLASRPEFFFHRPEEDSYRSRSTKDFGNDPGRLDTRQPLIEPLEPKSQSSVIDPQLVQNRGVQVANVNPVRYDVVTVIIGLAIFDSRLNPPAG